MGHRHHYLVVLLYCVFGLTAGTTNAQNCNVYPQQMTPLQVACDTHVKCDEGSAADKCNQWITLKRLHDQCLGNQPGAYHCEAVVTSPSIPQGHAAAKLGSGTLALFYWRGDCSARPNIDSGENSCPDSTSGTCLTCKDGCQYDEHLQIGANMSGGVTFGAFRHVPNGNVCNFGDDSPEPDDTQPEDPPCEGTMVGNLCITPYHFCAGNNCVQHPPPPTCSYGDPTLCVGNPPPAPNPSTPPGPEPDPCMQGTATANGGTFGVNIHCIEDDPPPSECDVNPNLPQCQPPDDDDESFCQQNPQHVDCQTYCQLHPDEEICGGEGDEETFCEENPSHPSCQGSAFCTQNPTHPSCQQGDYCTQNPTSPICTYCQAHPEQQICGGQGTCATNPSDPACQFCALHPNDPVCQNSGNTCQDNPQHPSCEDDDNNASGGGTCGAAPVCSGDSILCNSLYQQWQARCQLEKLTGEGEEPEEIDGDAEDHYEETMIGSDVLDTSGFLGGGGCPAISFNLNFFGASQAVDPLWCQILPWLGWLVVAAATVTAVRIIGGG